MNTRVGDYELQERLGRGAQGRVYRAKCVVADNPHVSQGEIVALKVMRQGAEDEKGEALFRRQVEVLQALSHPNIVQYRESFVAVDEFGEDLRCIVMEQLRGETLKQHLESLSSGKGMPWEEVQCIFEQCLSALSYAQAVATHRDIKPSNIFLVNDDKKTVKLIDFGIARIQKAGSTVTTDAGPKGAFDYMAPDFLPVFEPEETFRGDEASDIFSLTACFYEALTGSPPFPSVGETGWMGYLNRWGDDATEELAFSHDIFKMLNDRVEAFVRKGLARDRKRRYISFGSMLEDLAKIQRRGIQRGEETYDFVEYLGKGGFGRVYKAVRRSDKTVFAIKKLNPQKDPERFVREARLLRENRHANIVGYEDFVCVERLGGADYYLVMEFLEGMPGWNLRERVRFVWREEQRRGLPIHEVRILFCAYLEALNFLHGREPDNKPVIIHRDLKPTNLYAPPLDVLLEGTAIAKIFDMGIARSEDTETCGHVPGSPDYTAPEFVTNKDFRGSPQSDIFSLGLCLYEALAGERAYPRITKETMYRELVRRAKGEVSINYEREVFEDHPDLLAIVRRALALRPEERYATAAEMWRALAEPLGPALPGDTTVDPGFSTAVSETYSEAPAPETLATAHVEKSDIASISVALPARHEKEQKSAARASTVAPTSVRRAAPLKVLVSLTIVAAVLAAATATWKLKGRELWRVRRFTLSATDLANPPVTSRSTVGRLRAALNDVQRLKLDYPEQEKLGAAELRLMGQWAEMPAEFDGAFVEAMAAGNLEEARHIGREWEGIVPLLPFNGLGEASYERRRQMMGQCLSLADRTADVKTDVVTGDGIEKLESLLSWVNDQSEDDSVPLLNNWWKKEADTLRERVRNDLPAAFLGSVETAIAERETGAAVALIDLWPSTDSAPALAGVLAAETDDWRQSVRGQSLKILMDLRNGVVSAYARGDVDAAAAFYKDLNSMREHASMLHVDEAYSASLDEALSAQVGYVMQLADEISEQNLQGHMAKIVPVYTEWGSGWSNSQAEQAAELLRRRCLETARKHFDRAKSLYEAGEFEEGDEAAERLESVRASALSAAGGTDIALLLTALGRIRGDHTELKPEIEQAGILVGRLTSLVDSLDRAEPDKWPAAVKELAALVYVDNAAVNERRDLMSARLEEYIAEYVARLMPLELRAERLARARGILDDMAGLPTWFAAEAVESLRRKMQKEEAAFVLRFQNMSSEKVVVNVNEGPVDTVVSGAIKDIRIASGTGPVDVRVNWGAAYHEYRKEVIPVRGGGGRMECTNGDIRPRPRVVVPPRSPVVTYRVARPGAPVLLAKETALAPGSYTFLYEQAGNEPQEVVVLVAAGADPLDLPRPTNWRKKSWLRVLETLEALLARFPEDDAVAQAAEEARALESKLAEVHADFVQRARDAIAASKGKVRASAESGWDRGVAYWGQDWASAADAFNEIAGASQEPEWEARRNAAYFNQAMCGLMAAESGSDEEMAAARRIAGGGAGLVGNSRSTHGVIVRTSKEVTTSRNPSMRKIALVRLRGDSTDQGLIRERGPLPLPGGDGGEPGMDE